MKPGNDAYSLIQQHSTNNKQFVTAHSQTHRLQANGQQHQQTCSCRSPEWL